MQCCEFVVFKVCTANNIHRERWVGRSVGQSVDQTKWSGNALKGFYENIENLIPLPNGHYRPNTTFTHALIYSHYISDSAEYIFPILSIFASISHRCSKFMMPLLFFVTRHYLLNFIFSDETWFSWIIAIKKSKQISKYLKHSAQRSVQWVGMSNGSKWGIN